MGIAIFTDTKSNPVLPGVAIIIQENDVYPRSYSLRSVYWPEIELPRYWPPGTQVTVLTGTDTITVTSASAGAFRTSPALSLTSIVTVSLAIPMGARAAL